MTTPSELADELDVILSTQFQHFVPNTLSNFVILNQKTILSALRRVEKMEGALRKIAAFGLGERPNEPEYDCGNSGDISYAASRLAEWCLAQTARQALTGEAS